jgi:hypothetical protein
VLVDNLAARFIINPVNKRAYLTTKSKDLVEEHDDAFADTDSLTKEVTVCTGAVDVLNTRQVSRQVLGSRFGKYRLLYVNFTTWANILY